MTKTGPISVRTTFADHLQLFEFFLDYWNAKNPNIYNDHDAFFKEIESYSNLHANWKFNWWDIKELEVISTQIDKGSQGFNPTNFFFWGGGGGGEITFLRRSR